MLGDLARQCAEVAAVRVCVEPKSSARQQLELGIEAEDLATNDAYFGDIEVSLSSHLDWVFSKLSQKNKPPSRFTDGTIPVFYTALERETAFREKSHWLTDYVASPLRFQVVSVDFEGAFKDLRLFDPLPVFLTGESAGGAYAKCLALTQEALGENLDALTTPSARAKPGTCFPIFSRPSIIALRPGDFIRFIWDDDVGEWHVHAA